jgi:hypothetical protein
MKRFIQQLADSLKAILILLAASAAFIILISVFPLLGSLTVENFPLSDVLLDNARLLLILCVLSIPLGFFLGFLAGKIKSRRMFWLILLGLVSYWLIILATMMILSGFSLSGTGFVDLIKISLWAMLAYSMFAMPFVVLAIFFIERWTRK